METNEKNLKEMSLEELKQYKKELEEKLRKKEEELNFIKGKNIDWNNKEDILKKVEKDYLILINAPEILKKDKNFMLKAIAINAEAIKCSSESIINDFPFRLKAIETNPKVWECFKNTVVVEDPFFMLDAVKQDGMALKYTGPKLQNYSLFGSDVGKAIVKEAVKQNGLALEFAMDRFKEDFEICLEAVKNNPNALKFVSEELKNDIDFMIDTIEQTDLNKFMIAKEEFQKYIDINSVAVSEILVEKFKEYKFSQYYDLDAVVEDKELLNILNIYQKTEVTEEGYKTFYDFGSKKDELVNKFNKEQEEIEEEKIEIGE